VKPNSEMLALIAYLHKLGRDLKPVETTVSAQQ
jgi:hypothetical protein